MVLISSFLFSQTHPRWIDESKAVEPLVYSEIIEVDNKSKEVLYKNFIEWSSDVFNYSDFAIKYKDADLGIIKGTSGFKIKGSSGMIASYLGRNVNFDFKLEFKDNKLRYKIDNIIHSDNIYYFGLITIDKSCPYEFKGGGNIKPNTKKRDKFWSLVKTQIDEQITSLEATILNKSQEEVEEW